MQGKRQNETRNNMVETVLEAFESESLGAGDSVWPALIVPRGIEKVAAARKRPPSSQLSMPNLINSW